MSLGLSSLFCLFQGWEESFEAFEVGVLLSNVVYVFCDLSKVLSKLSRPWIIEDLDFLLCIHHFLSQFLLILLSLLLFLLSSLLVENVKFDPLIHMPLNSCYPILPRWVAFLLLFKLLYRFLAYHWRGRFFFLGDECIALDSWFFFKAFCKVAGDDCELLLEEAFYVLLFCDLKSWIKLHVSHVLFESDSFILFQFLCIIVSLHLFCFELFVENCFD